MTACRRTRVMCLAIYAYLISAAHAQFNPFASGVIDINVTPDYTYEYKPAPGQFVNDPKYNDINEVLGAPTGAGTSVQNSDSVVSLGRLGGQVVLAFDHDVEDNPANPMGLDAIVFGNAFWPCNDPQVHFSEPATIEIMPELNGNTIPGDDPNEIWYLIPGSDLNDTSDFTIKTWIRDSNTQLPGDYPAFPGWPSEYDTGAFELFRTFQFVGGNQGVVVNPYYLDSDPCNDDLEAYWGYAEYAPTVKLGDRDADNDDEGYGDVNTIAAEVFYTTPDDPFVVDITPGSGGGDAFDIAWAVDPQSWQPANISSFRYIRITNAIDEFLPAVGEFSAEIDAVADVRPEGDIDADNDVDWTDLYLFTQSWLSEWSQDDFDAACDIRVDNIVNLKDYARFAWSWGKYKQFQQ